MFSSTYAVNFLQDFYGDNTYSCSSVRALNKSWGMKSSLLRPSRICGIWWAMAEKWPASLWQVCIRGRPFPGDRIHSCRLPSLQSQSPVHFCLQKLLVTGRKLVSVVCLGATLSSLARGCLCALPVSSLEGGGCVSGRSMSVTTAALYLSEPGFSWGQGCCTPLCTGAELKTNEASDQTQPVSQLSPALTPRTPVLVSPPLCFSQSLA